MPNECVRWGHTAHEAAGNFKFLLLFDAYAFFFFFFGIDVGSLALTPRLFFWFIYFLHLMGVTFLFGVSFY